MKSACILFREILSTDGPVRFSQSINCDGDHSQDFHKIAPVRGCPRVDLYGRLRLPFSGCRGR
jgi:hypothetical protein